MNVIFLLSVSKSCPVRRAAFIMLPFFPVTSAGRETFTCNHTRSTGSVSVCVYYWEHIYDYVYLSCENRIANIGVFLCYAYIYKRVYLFNHVSLCMRREVRQHCCCVARIFSGHSSLPDVSLNAEDSLFLSEAACCLVVTTACNRPKQSPSHFHLYSDPQATLLRIHATSLFFQTFLLIRSRDILCRELLL